MAKKQTQIYTHLSDKIKTSPSDVIGKLSSLLSQLGSTLNEHYMPRAHERVQ